MAWQDALKDGQEIVLATSSKSGNVNAIIVICKGFVDNKILINVCQMESSLNNIQENSKIAIVTKYNGEYYRIRGRGTLHSSGKYFDIAIERNESSTPEVKFALTIDIENVFDLDKIKPVSI